MLNLAEELLLLVLNGDKGIIRWALSSRYPYTIAGALLMELDLCKRISVQAKELIVIDRTPIGQPLLDEVLQMIDSDKKVRAPLYWVSRIGRRSRSIRKKLMEGLVDQGILNSEEHLVLGIFPTMRFPIRDERPKKKIYSDVRTIIMRGELSTPRMTMLIGLIHACALSNDFFDREERKDARRKIKEIANALPIVQAIIKAIQRAQAAQAAG